jgi:hypothetical protein
MQNKYLILTASYWSWHNAAKDSIANYLKNKWEDSKVVDLIDLMWTKWANSKKFYEFSIKEMPILWHMAYMLLEISLYNAIICKYIWFTYQKAFNKIISEYSPDNVICLFPDWIKFLDNYFLSNKKTFNTCAVITDSIEIWTPWNYWSESIDEYFVIDKWSKEAFIKKFNHIKDNVNVSFFPIEEKNFTDKKQINNKKILFLLSWIKKEFSINLLKWLQKDKHFKSIAVCWWRNRELLNFLKSLKFDKRFIFLEYPNIREMLKNYDIMVSKPWWAIMAECIANDTILISPSYIPWQEFWNIKLLQKSWTWFFENDVWELIKKIKGNDLSAMLGNFQNVKNKESIKYIIDKLNKK